MEIKNACLLLPTANNVKKCTKHIVLRAGRSDAEWRRVVIKEYNTAVYLMYGGLFIVWFRFPLLHVCIYISQATRKSPRMGGQGNDQAVYKCNASNIYISTSNVHTLSVSHMRRTVVEENTYFLHVNLQFTWEILLHVLPSPRTMSLPCKWLFALWSVIKIIIKKHSRCFCTLWITLAMWVGYQHFQFRKRQESPDTVIICPQNSEVICTGLQCRRFWSSSMLRLDPLALLHTGQIKTKLFFPPRNPFLLFEEEKWTCIYIV